jgi:parallel beta-helix repeat protein
MSEWNRQPGITLRAVLAARTVRGFERIGRRSYPARLWTMPRDDSQRSSSMSTRRVPVFVSLGLGLAALEPSISAACTVTMGGTTYPTIQAAVTAAGSAGLMVTQVNVDGSTGACIENVLIPNVTLRMVILGANNATIMGAPSSPTLDVRVKGFMAQNVTVNGGSRGIKLRRNVNAIVDQVTVQNAAGDGITADSMALAVVTSSTIQGNGGSGIVIEQLATGRIGSNLPEDGGALAPNTIQNNTGDGITVAYTSNAYIVGNTITGNQANGISVQQSSSAFAADNLINSNGLAGISVSDNSSLDLPAAYNTAGFQTTPNQTTANNVTYGIYCISGGAVQGHLGSSNPLRGSTSQFGGGTAANTFESTCPNPAGSLLVP